MSFLFDRLTLEKTYDFSNAKNTNTDKYKQKYKAQDLLIKAISNFEWLEDKTTMEI